MKRAAALKLFATFVALIVVVCLSTQKLFADTPQPPAGSSAEVIEKKTRQQINEALKGSFAPPKLSLHQEEVAAEEGEAQKEFYVRKIHLEGDTLILAEEADKILKVFEERTQTINEMNKVCRLLEIEYQKRGYVAVIYMPPQRLENQELTLKVVASKLGEVHLEGARYYRQAQTLSYWGIKKGEFLRFEEVRANILRMNENPDRAVRGLLKSGKETGFTDVYLQEEDRSPFHTGVSLDNHGAKLTGRERPSFYIRNNNLTGRDDIFVANTMFANDVAMIYLYHLLPIPIWDLRLATHFSHAHVSPKKEFKEYDLQGVSQDYGFQLRRWIFKRDDAVLDGFAGFTFNEKRTRGLGNVIARDRLRMPSLGADFQSVDGQGGWSSEGSWTFGLPFHDEQTALMSRQAGTSFSKFNFDLKRIQKLPENTRGVLAIQGQWTPDNLMPQQEFFLGGANSVRGYPESDYGADYGISTNLEYWVPVFFLPESWKVMNSPQPLKKQTDFVFFVDHGYGRLNKPSATEHASRSLLGAGAGINFNFNENLQANFTWGFPLGDSPLTESGNSQFYFKVQSNY